MSDQKQTRDRTLPLIPAMFCYISPFLGGLFGGFANAGIFMLGWICGVVALLILLRSLAEDTRNAE